MIEVVQDFETRSRVDIRKAGAWKYAGDPSTEVICLCYHIVEVLQTASGRMTRATGPVKTWDPEIDPAMPADLRRAYEAGAIFISHAAFEQAVYARIMGPRYGWPVPPISQWHDIQAACAYRALPLKLEKAGAVLKLQNQKDMDGNRVLGQVSKPSNRKKTKGQFDNDLGKLQRVVDYCVRDVLAEEELHGRAGYLPPPERRLWELDQLMQQRGVRFDLPFVRASLEVVRKVEDKLTRRLREVTHGTVETHNQVDRFIDWLSLNGCDLPDMQADTVRAALDRTDLTPATREALEIRQTLAKAGTKKLTAILNCADADGRARYLTMYHGATTGRWAGRLMQPQNFQRPEEEFEKLDIEQLVSDIHFAARTADVEFLEMLYHGDAMQVVANAMRGTIIAADGHDLGAGDFNQIEARVLVCLAGETWKIEKFRDPKFDPYCEFAGFIYGHPVNKKEHPVKRTNGKIGELAFGYQGGVGAWRGFEEYKVVKKYGRRTDEEVDGFKNKWRDMHPRVKALWYGLENASVGAVATGRPHEYAGIEYALADGPTGRALTCRLPSGRLLWYNNPGTVEVPVPWDDDETRLQLTYEAFRYGRWRTIYGYGGLMTENVVQAASRDLMVPAMLKLEAAGYPCILTVHDEVVTEPREGHGDAKVFEQIMADNPEWARGWPIKAEAWIGKRYHK